MQQIVISLLVGFAVGVIADHFYGAKVIADARLEYQKDLADLKARLQVLEAKLPKI